MNFLANPVCQVVYNNTAFISRFSISALTVFLVMFFFLIYLNSTTMNKCHSHRKFNHEMFQYMGEFKPFPFFGPNICTPLPLTSEGGMSSRRSAFSSPSSGGTPLSWLGPKSRVSSVTSSRCSRVS